MKVYNLTDQTPAWEKIPRNPTELKFRGEMIRPGEHIEVPDRFLSELSGWVMSHVASVDGLPAWYQEAKQNERLANHTPEILIVEEPPKEKPSRRRKGGES
jgi:hypothetical protein